MHTHRHIQRHTDTHTGTHIHRNTHRDIQIHRQTTTHTERDMKEVGYFGRGRRLARRGGGRPREVTNEGRDTMCMKMS